MKVQGHMIVGRKARNGTPGNDANLLPWVKEWNDNKVKIGTEYVISPKTFSGTNSGTDENPILTGIAMGRDCLTDAQGNKRTGIFALVDNEVVFELDPITRKYLFKGRVEADEGVFKGELNIADGKVTIHADGSGWLANKGITWDKNGDNVNFTGFLNGAIKTPIRIHPAKGLNYLNVFKNGSNDFFIHISPGQSATSGLTLPSSSNYIGLSLKIILVYAYGTYGNVRIVPEDENISNLYIRWRNKKIRFINLGLGAYLELRGVPNFDSEINNESCDWVVTNASDYGYSITSEGTPYLTNIVL